MKISIYKKLDWWLIFFFLLLTFFGWINIYSSSYNDEHSSIFDFSQRYGMQFLWISISIGAAIIILFGLSSKIYSVFTWWFYIAVALLLLSVALFGVEINGSKSWFILGPVRFQPAEISKITTSLALASIMSRYGFKINNLRYGSKVILTLIIPILLILMEKETGSALIYLGFIFVLYREGLSGWYILFGLLAILLFILTLSFSPFISILLSSIILGFIIIVRDKKPIKEFLILFSYIVLAISSNYLLRLDIIQAKVSIEPEYLLLAILIPFVIRVYINTTRHKSRQNLNILLGLFATIVLIFSVNFIFDNILQSHQRSRIENLLGISEDLRGAGYNVHQSKIAIGSGGLTGKGFLDGTQTKYNFVPEQSTDFIFCTVGEEWGFIGSVALIIIYCLLITRLLIVSERQKDSFIRVYGYCVASCIFMHFLINIGMTIGLMPVIGIPLPFLSYGGSSMLTFTTLLFIFIRLDLERRK